MRLYSYLIFNLYFIPHVGHKIAQILRDDQVLTTLLGRYRKSVWSYLGQQVSRAGTRIIHYQTAQLVTKYLLSIRKSDNCRAS